VKHQPKEASLVNQSETEQRRRKKFKKAQAHYLKPTVDDNLDPENFPEQLEQFAIDVTTFLNCLNEFPEFTDEAVDSSIRSFEGDLKVSKACLAAHKSSSASYAFCYAVLGLVFESLQM
jgi:hypothetical protein